MSAAMKLRGDEGGFEFESAEVFGWGGAENKGLGRRKDAYLSRRDRKLQEAPGCSDRFLRENNVVCGSKQQWKNVSDGGAAQLPC